MYFQSNSVVEIGSGEYYLEELEDEPCPQVNVIKLASVEGPGGGGLKGY